MQAGQKVTINVDNSDGVEHSFTFPKANVDKDVGDHKAITVRFTAPGAGTYEFHCKYHPTAMRGTITVR